MPTMSLGIRSGVNWIRLKSNESISEIELIIKRDFDEAERLEIEGTPTFFVDGYMIDFEQLEAKILKAKGAE